MNAYPADLIGPVEIGPVAHGGHCVARHEGRVIFVRHALPGETVTVQVTDRSHQSFWRGDAVEILTASPDRVAPRCPIAGPGLCGGCDFQHVELDAQRALKTAVVAEQLERLAGLTWDGAVEPVDTDGTADGLHWRTRMRYQTDEHGRPGLRGHRSAEVVPLPEQGCVIASPRTVPVVGHSWPADAELITAGSATQVALLVDGRLESGVAELTERAADRDWAVAANGFWQVHPGAADTLVGAVLAGLAPEPGERAFDLYCGVGLFAGALADAGCRVWGVESSRFAIATARRNLADVGDGVRLSADRVDRGLPKLPGRTDLVVLDPPRTGAGKAVMQAVAARRPRAIAYVACDPAALARDLGTAQTLGYAPVSIRAFDLFPMTHHVECVAILTPV
ncbi:MAG TPA: class I SAM-dependent RNA methyltransferase [Propionibacteriaceae bacterium]